MSTVNRVVDESGDLLRPDVVPTEPYDDQKPALPSLGGQIQSTFDCLPDEDRQGATLVVSGDGRYHNDVAIQTIVKMAAANGFARLWIGQNGLLATPAVSAVIREREGGVASGGIILTASHNPGGPEGDFGIKYNARNGGPAPESLTNAIFERSKRIDSYRIARSLPDVDLNKVGRTVYQRDPSGDAVFEVEVIDCTDDYSKLLFECFDKDAIRSLLQRSDFRFVYDAMHGAAGAHAGRIFEQELGAPAGTVQNATPLPDFGGGHPDPNLVYAESLVATMGLRSDGSANPDASGVPDFGAAADGDGDRNMVLGRQFFVTPSDSVAVIAANADAIPQFSREGGLRGVARSMPTSAALDRVAEMENLRLFEVPTGWKFFGNLMDSAAVFGKENYTPFLCGEESFGTGSSHIREKDGIWAVLAWLSILAHRNRDTAIGDLLSVEDIVKAHWARYGRHYYRRYDYEGVDADRAAALMEHLRARADTFSQAKAAHGPTYEEPVGVFSLADASEFNYTDPVTGEESLKQGMRFLFADGSRVVFRLSGTGSVGATIRMYLEKFEPAENVDRLDLPVHDALAPFVAAALELCRMEHFTGRTEPTVIT